MKILIVTSLFPPDTADSASYVKELASRLSGEHQVTVLMYGKLPESVSKAELIAIEKSRNVVLRIFAMTRKLRELITKHDVVLLQNGPSVEFPCWIAKSIHSTPVIFMESDQSAQERTKEGWFRNMINFDLRKRAAAIFSPEEIWPNDKPVIHPLKEKPEAELRNWEESWKRHLDKLAEILKPYVKE